MTKWSGFPRADGQEGDQFKASKGSVVMEESCWLVAKLMVAGEVEESNEANSMRAWGLEQGVGAINKGRSGPMLPFRLSVCFGILWRKS